MCSDFSLKIKNETFSVPNFVELFKEKSERIELSSHKKTFRSLLSTWSQAKANRYGTKKKRK